MGLTRAEAKRFGIPWEDHAPRRKRAPSKVVGVPSGQPTVPPSYFAAAGRTEIVVPGWRPALASELKCHPMKAGRLKHRDADVLRCFMIAYRIPEASCRRRVSLVISGRYGNFPDRDAPLKSGLDALKQAGLIVDDSDRWCEWLKPEYVRGPRFTRIILEDLEAGA